MAQERGPIVVVEDDTTVRQLIGEILRHAGYQVVEFGGAEEALAFLETVQPALITLDLAMPCVDGFRFLRLLQQRPGVAHVPVVVVTAAPEFLRSSVAVLGHPVVAKPFLMSQLIGAVERSLEMRPSANQPNATTEMRQ